MDRYGGRDDGGKDDALEVGSCRGREMQRQGDVAVGSYMDGEIWTQ